MPKGMAKKKRKPPRIKFHFTANRKKDTLRFLIAGVFFLSLITVYWNNASTPLKSLASGYQGYIIKGRHKQMVIDEKGVALIKDWLEQQTSPTINPLTILVNHQQSRKPTQHYQLAIGMVSTDEEAIREYAIYQNDHTIYLQVEPLGIDRVLDASFSIEDLESALEPYIKGEFRSNITVSQ